MTFGEKVKLARQEVFMSQQTFAKELGVSFTSVNRWETGKFKPSYKAQKLFHDYCVQHDIHFEENL